MVRDHDDEAGTRASRGSSATPRPPGRSLGDSAPGPGAAGTAGGDAYRQLFEASPLPMWAYDLETLQFVAVNRAAVEHYGYSPEEFAAMTIADIRPSEEVGRLLENVASVTEGLDRAGIWQHRLKDGSIIDVEIVSHTLELDGRECELVLAVDVTEKRRAAAILRLSEERYRRIVETAEEGIWTLDADSRTSFVNAKMSELLGYTVDEMLGRHLHDFMDEEGRRIASANLERRRQGVREQHEFCFLRKDGSPLWATLSTNPIHDENGQYVGALAMVTDATHRREAEQRLRKLNRTYSMMSEVNQLIVRERDVERLLQQACATAVDKGGFGLAAIALAEPGGGLRLRAHAGATPETVALLHRSFEAADPACAFSLEAFTSGRHAVCADIAQDPAFEPWRAPALALGLGSMAAFALTHAGTTFGILNLYARDAGAFDADEVQLLEGLSQDLAFALEAARLDREHRLAVEALRESERRFHQMTEVIDEVFWSTDPSMQRVHFVSAAYERVWGRSCESLRKDPGSWGQAIHAEDRARVHEALTTRLLKGAFDEEYRIVRPDGGVRWVRDQGFVVRDAEGVVERVVGVARDITQRRTLELQLRQSQKMQAIGQLAGGIAHDFNNILTAILIECELTAAHPSLANEVRDALSSIGASAERAAGLTRQLLTFSRRQVMQLRDVDLNEAVRQLAIMLRRILGEDVRLTLDLEDVPLVLRADPGMVDQVLMNLAVNSRDAMPEGGELLIRTRRQHVDDDQARRAGVAGGAYAHLTVHDDGIGMTSEVQERMFEPFFTTKAPGQGTGLGLATVFAAVQQHGGSLHVDSAPGRGSTVEVLFPLGTGAAMQPERAAEPAARTSGAHHLVLLAEDEEPVRTVTQRVLRSEGFRVLEAANAAEALALWEAHAEDITLLVTDRIMPGGKSGQDLVDELRLARPELPVVFISGYTPELAGRPLTLGPTERFVPKPFTPSELLTAIRGLLASSRGAESASGAPNPGR